MTTALSKVFSAPKGKQSVWCNAALIVVAVLMLISSIQMEALGGDDLWGISFTALTFIHAGFGIAMFSLVAWHLYLHFGNLEWLKKLGKSVKLTKALAIFGSVSLVSGLFILIYMLSTFEHNLVGAIHGKIGFVFLALGAFHIIKHRQWIQKKIFA